MTLACTIDEEIEATEYLTLQYDESIEGYLSSVIGYVSLEGGGDEVSAVEKDKARLEFHLSQAVSLAANVRPEIVESIKALQSGEALPSFSSERGPRPLPAGARPNQPPSHRRVADLTPQELMARREKERLIKKAARAKRKGTLGTPSLV